MTGIYARLSELALHLPSDVITTEETEDRLAERNPGFAVPRGLIQQTSGVRSRHVAPNGWTSVELAVAAADKLLANSGRDISEVDLLLFAATSFPFVEPATVHAVGYLLGARCAMFDVRNTCSSVVNAMEVADALIRTGRHRRVLIVCGEWTTPTTRWKVSTFEEFISASVSYTVSDAGAALLMEASEEPGVLGGKFAADPRWFQAALVPMRHPTGIHGDGRGVFAPSYDVGEFRVDIAALMKAFGHADLSVVTSAFAELGLVMSDFAVVCVHQPFEASLPVIAERLGAREDQLVPIMGEHGNVAAASLPLQLQIAVDRGQVQRGDLVALVSLASGISYGCIVLRW
jgi:3-oxoacyl-[acyl-carrier-protein] synthase-3